MENFGTGDDFSNLKNKKLFIGCTDQDTFEHVTFGPENASVPISKAVRASCALLPRCSDHKRYMVATTSTVKSQKAVT